MRSRGAVEHAYHVLMRASASGCSCAGTVHEERCAESQRMIDCNLALLSWVLDLDKESSAMMDEVLAGLDRMQNWTPPGST